MRFSQAKQATVNGTSVRSDTMFRQLCAAGTTTVLVLDLSPTVVVEKWAGDLHGGAATAVCENDGFEPFIVNMNAIFLPRQARDKHIGKLKKDYRFSAGGILGGAWAVALLAPSAA
jgi:hypothetical protein